MLKLTSENRVIKKFKSFILGYCNCPCRVEIQIRNKQGKLSRFKHGHNAVGEMNRNYGVHKFREESPRWKGGEVHPTSGAISCYDNLWGRVPNFSEGE